MAKAPRKKVSDEEKIRRQRQSNKSRMLRNDNGWDDCQAVYASCVDLLQQPMLIQVVLQQPGVDAAIDPAERSTLDDGIILLTRDTKAMSEKLQGIYQLHRGKSGPCRTPDDFALSLNLYEKYIEFMEVYRSTLQPTFNEVMEIVAKAERKVVAALQAHEAQQMAQDPNNHEPITVTVKETDLPTLGTHKQVVDGKELEFVISEKKD